jgi:uncharacterized iron-regulated protein
MMRVVARPRPQVAGFLLGASALAVLGCDGTGAGPGPGQTPDGGVAPSGYLGMLPTTLAPYRLMWGRGSRQGQDMQAAQLLAEMDDADAVCLGEIHDDRDQHAAQLLVLDRFVQQARTAGRRIALGMEMFQLPFQAPLDDYSARLIDEQTMLVRTQWQQRWNLDYGFYRPLIDHTIEAGGAIRALNARDEIIRRIGLVGLEGLTADERREIPELDLTNAQHRAWFEQTIAGISGHGAVALNNLYAAQVVRDETMAQTAWSWLAAQEPARRQVAIAAGQGHCMDLAIPMRLRRRGARKVLIVHPVPETDAEITAALAEGFSDLLVIFAR